MQWQGLGTQLKHAAKTLHLENSKEIFLEMNLCSLIPNSYIQISVSDPHIPRIGPPNLLQQNRQTYPGNICINRSHIHECGNRKRVWAGSFLGIHKSDLLCSAVCVYACRAKPFLLISSSNSRSLDRARLNTVKVHVL